MKKVSRIILIIVCSFLLIITVASPAVAQTQQTALLAIQQAESKLYETISLLEDASTTKIDIRDLVRNTDDARQLIVSAKDQYNNANFTDAQEKASEAIEELNLIINELELRKDKNQQNNAILYSLLGVFSAILIVLFLFSLHKWIYPWYIEKRNEEYGKLIIKYKEETEIEKK